MFPGLARVSPEGDRVDFDEYIKEARAHDMGVVTPDGRNNESVQELAEKVPATNREIANRLELLALPEKVQTMIQQEELTVTAGMEISRLRQIPDAERRKKLMEDLAQEDQYRGLRRWGAAFNF